MRINRNINLLLAAALTVAGVTAVRADETAEKARAVFSKHGKCVVTVQLTQKISASMQGRSGTPRENRLEISGTVVDPSGLTVVALSACDPSDILVRMGSPTKVDTELSDIKILQEDNSEIAAEIVLRDKDLDLAFMRPKAKLASPMAAVDLGKSSPAQVLDEVVTLNRLNHASGRAYSASLERISAVVQKPRTFYIPDSKMTGTASGSPVFALDGNVVGLVVLRAVSSSGGSERDNVTSIILPAEDVVKGAKQAPEAKGDSDTKEPAKTDADKKSDDKK